MAQKVNNSLLNQIGRQKAEQSYGVDIAFEELNPLQLDTMNVIGKSYKVLDVIQSFVTGTNFFYFVTTATGHLLKFKIDEHGLFTVKTVPVWGGVNTPYHPPITKIGDQQINLLPL